MDSKGSARLYQFRETPSPLGLPPAPESPENPPRAGETGEDEENGNAAIKRRAEERRGQKDFPPLIKPFIMSGSGVMNRVRAWFAGHSEKGVLGEDRYTAYLAACAKKDKMRLAPELPVLNNEIQAPPPPNPVRLTPLHPAALSTRAALPTWAIETPASPGAVPTARERMSAVFKKVSARGQKGTATVKKEASKFANGLKGVFLSAVNTTKVAFNIGPVKHRIDERRAAREKILSLANDVVVGVITSRLGGFAAAAVLGAGGVPTLGLMAGTALATGVIRLGYECYKDYRLKPQIGWRGSLKKNFGRAAIGSVFGFMGAGLVEIFDHFAFPTPTPAPVPAAPDIAPPAAPVAVVPEPSTVAVPEPATPAPSGVDTTAAQAAENAAAPQQADEARQAAREAWLAAENAETDRLIAETRHDIVETVQKFPNSGLGEIAPAIDTASDTGATSPGQGTALPENAELKNCQATGRAPEGGYLLECDKNPALEAGMTGTMKMSI